MRPIEYLSNWAFPYYIDAKLDLASSGLPEEGYAIPRISRDSSLMDTKGGEVIESSRKIVASFYDVKPQQVLLTLGASGGLFMTAFLMAQSRKPVVIESPVYEPIWRDYESLGIEIRWLNRRREQCYSLEPLMDKAHELTRGASCLVVTNPNNPTGQCDNRETIAKLAEAVKPAYLIVSEVYLPMVEGSRSVWGCADNVIIMQSLTKSYSYSCPRFGWVIADEAISEKLKIAKFYVIGNFSSASAAACIPILLNLEEVRKAAKAHLGDRIKYVRQSIRQHSRVSWIEPPSDVIIGSVKIDGVRDDIAFCKSLLEKHKVIMAPGVFFREPGTIRIGIGAKSEMFDPAFELFMKFAEDYRE